MPNVPDASSVTRFRRVNSTTLTDPTIKSAVFQAPLKNIINPVLRASDVVTPAQSVLSIPPWRSPQFKGRFFLK